MSDALKLRGAEAFSGLVRSSEHSMLRVATAFLGSRALAEEVVQDTWLSVYQGLSSFQGRSSLQTWMFAILLNRLRMQHDRESRATALFRLDHENPAFRCLDTGSLLDPYQSDWTRHLCRSRSPEEILLDKEAVEIAAQAIGKLPPSQRQVIMMRDIEGANSSETRAALCLSKANQRVLLHRARSKVRAALAHDSNEEGSARLPKSLAVRVIHCKRQSPRTAR